MSASLQRGDLGSTVRPNRSAAQAFEPDISAKNRLETGNDSVDSAAVSAPPVIASEAKQSIAPSKERMDCFVALLLAMTE
jgi:hypothetical protein